MGRLRVAAAKTMRRYSTGLIGRCNGLRLRLPLSHRGRAGAAHHRKTTDNSGERRSADRAGQQPFPSVRPGRPSTRIVSRTEEVRGSSPLTSHPPGPAGASWDDLRAIGMAFAIFLVLKEVRPFQ
jgi:hypothetical protein